MLQLPILLPLYLGYALLHGYTFNTVLGLSITNKCVLMDNLSQGLGSLVSFQPHHFRSQNGRGKGGLVFLGQFLGPAILNHSGQSDRCLIHVSTEFTRKSLWSLVTKESKCRCCETFIEYLLCYRILSKESK